jgi:hypothetical protein
MACATLCVGRGDGDSFLGIFYTQKRYRFIIGDNQNVCKRFVDNFIKPR